VTYASDVAALARKDLLLELRAKETLPSMLLFVIAALTIFHFALPSGTSDVAARGLLWAALIFTALLGLTRAFVAEREQSMFDALILTPVDRSAIWLGKSIAVFAFLVAAEVVALPAFAAFFHGLDGRTVAAVALADIGICTVGTLFGAMAVAGRARELLLPLLVGFIASFALSQGAVIWVYLSEVFPTAVRARGQSLGSATHWIMNAVVSAVFPAVAAYSTATPFAFFALMMALQFVVVLIAFPETKGVALERMAERMAQR